MVHDRVLLFFPDHFRQVSLYNHDRVLLFFPGHFRQVSLYNHDRVLLFFRMRSIIPTAHNSDSPLCRQPITPTAHYSDNPLFRQPIFPTANNLAQQRIFFMTSGPGKQTTVDKTIDSKSCRRSTRAYDEI